ncbi:hypothetical protein JCM3770_001205 [Rhodotorula araucariae]
MQPSSLYGFYPQAPHQLPPPHAQQPPPPHHQPGLVGYPPASGSPYAQQPAAHEIHVDATGHLAGPQAGPSGVGLQDHELPEPLGTAGDDDDSGILDTPGGGRKKGGRPRDKVWELFEGDRDVAKCCFCSWKTDHPKAFRMRAHALACDMIPQDRKDELLRYQEQKEQRQQIKKESADALQAAGGAPPKKAKRDHDGNAVPIRCVQPFRCPLQLGRPRTQGGCMRAEMAEGPGLARPFACLC